MTPVAHRRKFPAHVVRIFFDICLTYEKKSFIMVIGNILSDGKIMKIGVSTGCLYPELTENCVRELLAEGFDLFEIFFNTFSELEPDYLRKLNFMLNEKNAGVRSIHPFTSSYESYLLFSGYERRFEDGVRFYEMYFRTAKQLGADFVVLHGVHDSFAAISEKEYCRRFAVLAECAKAYGVTLLQENVNMHLSNRPGFIRTMLETIPDSANFVLDIKQALRGGYAPEEFAVLMGTKLRHIHISDCTEDDKCTLPGKGCLDYAAFFRTLQNIGYCGDLIIEVYGNSYSELSELTQSKEFLNKFVY